MNMMKLREVAQQDGNINHFLWKMCDFVSDTNLDILVLQYSEFIFTPDNQHSLEDFVAQLHKAEVKEFVITDNSTALMPTLHAFDKVGLKVVRPYKVDYLNRWYEFREELGILISVQ